MPVLSTTEAALPAAATIYLCLIARDEAILAWHRDHKPVTSRG